MLTFSHDDSCFYASELKGASELNRGHKEAETDISLYLAQEGNITFKQLSAEHQKEFLAARQKEANSLVPSGAVKILNDRESK